jgi:hypothetical protein
MRAFIDATKNDIKEFVSSISSLHPNISLRLAFIGYRDHCDKEDRLAVMRFTNSVQEFKNMVGNQVAKGGGDDAEDVLGGLHVVRGLDWSSETRILYHIADAPCHGRDFHRSDCSDDFPEGDPNGLKPDDILNDLLGLRVQYFFGKIKDRTDLMVCISPPSLTHLKAYFYSRRCLDSMNWSMIRQHLSHSSQPHRLLAER